MKHVYVILNQQLQLIAIFNTFGDAVERAKFLNGASLEHNLKTNYTVYQMMVN